MIMDYSKVVLYPVQLNNVMIQKVNVNKPFYDVDVKNYKSVENQILIETNVSKLDEESMVTVLSCIVKGMIDSKIDYTLEIEIAGSSTFESNSEFNQMQLEYFANITAVKSLWPYLRAYLSDLTHKLSIPQIDLPTIDVMKSYEESAK